MKIDFESGIGTYIGSTEYSAIGLIIGLFVGIVVAIFLNKFCFKNWKTSKLKKVCVIIVLILGFCVLGFIIGREAYYNSMTYGSVLNPDWYWLVGSCLGLIIGIVAIIILTRFYKKIPKILNTFFLIFFTAACCLSVVCVKLNLEIEALQDCISGARGVVGNLVDKTFGGGSGIVNFLFDGLHIEERASDFIGLGGMSEKLATAFFWRNILFILAVGCVALIMFIDKRRRTKTSNDSMHATNGPSGLGNDATVVDEMCGKENKAALAAVANGKIELSIDVVKIKSIINNKISSLNGMKIIGVISMILWIIFGLFFVIIFSFASTGAAMFVAAFFFSFIGLAFIPAKRAQEKGRDFWKWYVYGIWLWLIALIHASLIKKKEITSDIGAQTNEKPISVN